MCQDGDDLIEYLENLANKQKAKGSSDSALSEYSSLSSSSSSSILSTSSASLNDSDSSIKEKILKSPLILLRTRNKIIKIRQNRPESNEDIINTNDKQKNFIDLRVLRLKKLFDRFSQTRN